MSKQTHFESLAEALNQAIEYEKGNKSMGRLRILTTPDIEPVTDYSKDNPVYEKKDRRAAFGCLKGKFQVPDDFNEPLEDFKEYMS